MKVLALNGGSSSFKCALYEFSDGVQPSATILPAWKESLEQKGASLNDTLKRVLSRAGKIDAVGHRIVHGGPAHTATARVTDDVRTAIAAQSDIAPSHNHLELEAIDAVTALLGPGVPQFAVFDTTFHRTLAPAAYIYPGPREWFTSDGVRRYGFHGISYQHATRRAADLLGNLPERMLVCHLGNGASLCAVKNGKSIDTTMGFTPLEGLMMGARSGSVDPGVLLYLLRRRGYSAEQLDRILNRESGLLGVSGVSGDMREILAAVASGNAQARLAFDVYTHRLAREAGGMVAALCGLDALVFTGGVGENSPDVRDALCGQLSFLGLKIDTSANAHPSLDQNIAAENSSIPILVIRADEESEIARECWSMVSKK